MANMSFPSSKEGKTAYDDKSKWQDMLNTECLLDGFLALYDECTHESLFKIKHVASFVNKFNMAVKTAKTERMKASDFEVKAVIGRGHFGEVRVVTEKSTDEVYAMKVLRKAELLSQPEISFYEEERGIMASTKSSWITQLHYAFQDSGNLYLVMDFHAGGDLLSLLRRNDDIFEEEMAKFYIAEMALAINSLHEMGYIHRDIKPENVLLDHTGHVKLADFGSAAKLGPSGKVSAKLPVGTPDYVAPELLLAMNKGQGYATYGVEVDWWSLGVCSFEMLFGGTPFTTDETSTISTYANIMNYKKALQFPADSDVSMLAKDLIQKLLTNSQDRLLWADIKSHQFFSGIVWESIRKDPAFYEPSISGLDDTSHFVEVEKVRRQPDIENLITQRDFSGRDLPFVGFTFCKPDKAGSGNYCSEKKSDLDDLDNMCPPDKTIRSPSVVSMESHGFQLLAEKDAEIKHLKYLLNKERKHFGDTEENSVSLLNNLFTMNSELRSLEDELLEVKLEEMKGEIILLESELEKLSSQLRTREQELVKANAALEETNHQLQCQQMKLDKERRKSRECQRNDLMLLELRNETWESLLEEKQAHINELNVRMQELEKLVEAYEDSEERQATEVEQLEHKMNTSLSDLSSTLTTDVMISGTTGQAKVELDNFHHRLCHSSKKLTLHVTVKAGRCSFVDNSTLVRLQELQKIVDKYSHKAHKWQEREEELTVKIADLESENQTLKQKEGIGRKIKDSLMDSVTSYQQEVQTQKAVIKELQEAMRTYLNRSSTLSDKEKSLKELQQCKLELEAQLLVLREDCESSRQASIFKTSQMEEAIQQLEEQRVLALDCKKLYDSQMEATEEKLHSVETELAKVTADRQRLERRESTLITQVETLQSLLDDRNLEMEKLERRNMDIQCHLQQLQQRNTDLQVQVESLQKVSVESSDQKQSVTELNFQLSRLKQQNTDLERRVTTALRDKQGLDDKVTLSEREKERLERRIKRLEVAEQGKRELETKVETMLVIERENRRLQLKLDRLPGLEKDKLNLEEKIDKLQMDFRKEKITNESLIAENKSLESKLANLQSNKITDSNEEINQLKMKITLLETAEKERCALEKELKLARQKKTEAEGEKLLLEKLKEDMQKMKTEKIEVQRQKESVIKEKKVVEDKLTELMKEKTVSDDHINMLHKEVGRLETQLGVLTDQTIRPEVDKLSSEINRLKKLVDKLENDNTQETNRKRNSAEMKSSLIDKLQREKSDLQKQIELLEKTAASRNTGARPNKTSLTSLHQIKQADGEQNKLRLDELEVMKRNQSEKISRLTGELESKQKEVEELRSMLEVQTTSSTDLRAELEELMKTENDLLVQLEKEARNARSAFEEKEKISAQLKEMSTLPVKKDVDSNLGAQVEELKLKLAESQREVEIRKGASQFPGGDISAYLRHELSESNLALSEARSLLAASKRQELELKVRIDKLQKILENQAVENCKYIQNSNDAIAEVKMLKTQHDTLKRQYKVLEDKYGSLQKEHGSNSTETVYLSEEISTKQHQYEMEHKKVEQLTKVCKELEEQAQDMEAVFVKFQQRENEWESIKKSYEKAVGEREAELEGAAHHVQTIALARSEDSEKMVSMKCQMETTKAVHKAEMEKLNHNLREEMATVRKLSAKISELEDKERSSSEVFESQMREMNKLSREIMKLKEELTISLSDNSSLRKECLMLKKHLQDAMDKFELIIGEKVNLENFAETLQGLHFLDKYKFESTIGQQMKLIDYLQDLYMEHKGKKKKNKLFGMKAVEKDGFPRPTSGPLSWTDVQVSLEQEQHRCHQLQTEVDKLRKENTEQTNELLRLKQSNKDSMNSSGGRIERVQASLSLEVKTPSMNSSRKEMSAASSISSLATCASSSSSSSSHSGSYSTPAYTHTSRPSSMTKSIQDHSTRGTTPWMPDSTPQRMHHNIPHRFATGLNSRATKCGLCLGTVHFVRQASKCQDCPLVVHPKCASSVPATCGLPTEYVRHFELMMSHIYRDGRERESDIDSSVVKMEGWLKVPRVGKSGWENRYCVLEGTWLTLFLCDTDANPVDSFHLDPIDADVSVHSAVTSAELTNTASSDLHYILRLDQDPLTTCWPGRYLYLMTTNFPEKQRWVASLEAVVRSIQCKSDLYRNRSQMLTVLSLKDSDQREVNCSLIISPQLVLLGTEDGLYAFNPEALTSKHSKMTQLTGFGSVHQMALAKGVDIILVLTGPERRLVMLENKLVKCRMSQTLGGETIPFSFKMVEGLHNCTTFDVGLWNNASYLCVGTATKLFVMKYNPSLAMYCVRKEFPSSEACSCVCLAENYAIAGTQRFYKINLEHPSLLDFVDRQDSSLAFAAFGAANHNSFPLAVVRTSPENLPLEFLLCFHEFGVFVDHRGKRSRTPDIKWSGLPLAFAYIDPFLYVTYTNTIQATVVPTDRSLAKGRQTIMDIQSPRYLGPAPKPGCVYVCSTHPHSNLTEIVSIRGQENFSVDGSFDKENIGCTNAQSGHQVHFASPRKTPKIHRLQRQGSLSSLHSNSSGTTFGSVESGV